MHSKSVPARRIGSARFWVFASIELFLCVGLAIAWFHVRTEAYLAGPPDPDLFAQSRSFQWFTFAVFWLPAILVTNAIVLGIARVALRPRDC